MHFQSCLQPVKEHFVEVDGIELGEVVAYFHGAFGKDYKDFVGVVGIGEDGEVG